MYEDEPTLYKDTSAFPESCTSEGYKGNISSGLTKREYFAGLAMQGLLVNGPLGESMKREGFEKAKVLIAESAAGFADSLLTELEKRR